MRLLALIVAGIASALAGSAVALPAAASADVQLGIHVEPITQPELDRIALGGGDFVRAPIKWGHVQRFEDGVYDWTEYDAFLTKTATAGLPVLPVVIGSPRWAAETVADQPTDRHGLRRLADFVRALVDRYRPGGGFWVANPDLPYRPVGVWQIWNEPNSRHFWDGKPDPAEYARLLKRMSRAVRDSDPEARIMLAGMGEERENGPASEFVRDLYHADGIKASFDFAASHAYAERPRGVEEAVRRLRATLDAVGDHRTPIWITELGWASAGPPDDFRVTNPDGQAALLTTAFNRMLDKASELKLRRITWYEWRDRMPVGAQPASWVDNVGFFEVDGDQKPAWQAFTSLAGGDPGLGPLPSPESP